MTRYKWFFASWTIPISTIRLMMLAAQFTEEAREGFLLSRANDSFIEGKFIQKNECSIAIESPLGNEIETKKIEYSITSFRISNEKHIGLELLDPPKTIRPFISTLHKMMGLGMTVTDSSVDPLVWAEQIEKGVNTFWISEMQVCGVGISSSSIANIMIKSDHDVRKDVFELIEDRKHIIQHVKIYFTLQEDREKTCCVELRGNGTAQFHNGISNKLYLIVRNSLLVQRQQLISG